MERIRVLHVLEATVGGTARHLELAARFLPRFGVDVAFIASSVRNPDFFEQLSPHCAEGTPAWDVPMQRSISPVRDIAASGRLEEIISRYRPDIVHTHASKAGFLGRRAAWLWRVPVVHTPHVFAMEWALGMSLGIYRLLEKYALRWTDRLVVLHEEQRRIAEDMGFPKERISYVPNGVDIAHFQPPSSVEVEAAREELGLPEQAKVVGMACRLEPQKGAGTFIRAARDVLQIFPGAVFIVAGSGSMSARLRKRADKFGISGSLRFLGDVQHMRKFYHAIDVFVLASLWEGQPYAVLEAQACALPVVATATPGVVSLIDPGCTGTLVPLGSAEALAGAVCAYLREPVLRERVGAKARGYVEQEHSALKWAENLAGIYRQTISS